MNEKNRIRLDKYLANSGISSRRKIGELVKKGSVLINGQKALESGQRIDVDLDKVVVDGKAVKKGSNFVYFVLNKPLGVVSTTSDENGKETVVSLIESPIRLYPVGRLDSDSIGLILLTNDGELTHKLTHPKFHIPKTYEVLVHGKVSKDQLKILREGVKLKDGMTAPSEVEIIEEFRLTTKLKFVLHEGKNRQIRRMAGKVGLEVLELKRVGIGEIKLGLLGIGESRRLTDEEVESLKTAVGLI